MKKKPNVILMLADDLGYGDVSAFNKDGKIHTSNIDALAESGMMFTDSHACSALCTPSRYGLLTGRYNWRSRLKAMVLPGDSATLIEKGRQTLADVFKQAGYHTACVGKWHLGLEWQVNPNPRPEDFGEEAAAYENLGSRPVVEPALLQGKGRPYQGYDLDYTKPILYGPNQYGFDYFFGLPASLDQPPYVYIENDRVVEKPDHVSGELVLNRHDASMSDKWQRGPTAPSYDHEQVLDDMNNKVLDLIDEYAARKEPFFIYYPTPAVHGPLLPKPEFKGKSGLNDYADIVLQMDDYVGRITEKLKELGIEEDTIFIFTSDNGCSGIADIPFLTSQGHNPSSIFRGIKFSLYEGGHRVPTIVSYPGSIRAGSTCGRNVCHTDFMRTFADLLEISLPDDAGEDSISNLPLWLEKDTGYEREATVYSSGAGYFGAVSGKWKLACCENGGDSPEALRSAFTHEKLDQRFELYDIEGDVREQKNVIDQYPEEAERLKAFLTDCLERGRSTNGQPQKNYIPDYPWIQINWMQES